MEKQIKCIRCGEEIYDLSRKKYCSDMCQARFHREKATAERHISHGEVEFLEGEVWKSIVGHGDFYMVSNKSRFLILKRSIPTSTGVRSYRSKIVPTRVGAYGYLYVPLFTNGKIRFKAAHRYIAKAFIPNPDNKPQVNHKSGIKTDNRVENLEWCTRSENVKHAFSIGLSKINKEQRDRFVKMAKNATGGNNPSSVKVINTESGVVYETVSEAARSIDMKISTLVMKLRGVNKNNTKLKYYE